MLTLGIALRLAIRRGDQQTFGDVTGVAILTLQPNS
jgi:hypothetical protein